MFWVWQLWFRQLLRRMCQNVMVWRFGCKAEVWALVPEAWQSRSVGWGTASLVIAMQHHFHPLGHLVDRQHFATMLDLRSAWCQLRNDDQMGHLHLEDLQVQR
jgi:hypothetical protein